VTIDDDGDRQRAHLVTAFLGGTPPDGAGIDFDSIDDGPNSDVW
jgi:hypothetical protein